MRITFTEMHLFKDTSQKHDTSFMLNGKAWGEGKIGQEREKEREWKECGMWCVAEKELCIEVWVKNLTVSQIFMRAQRRDNPTVYQDGNKAYPKNF
jgi:hypothetical protein